MAQGYQDFGFEASTPGKLTVVDQKYQNEFFVRPVFSAKEIISPYLSTQDSI